MTGFAIALAAALFVVAGLWWRDRRRLHETERALADLQQAARRGDDARETFFDLVTHELRSPLAAVLGYQELLRDGAYGEFEPQAEEPIDRIGRSARHLLHLIDGVVGLSRLRTGTVKPQLAPVSLGIILSAVGDAFRTHARERLLEPTISMPPSLPIILSDQDRLVRALDMLVTSAVKHPAGSEMALTVEAHQDGATVRITGTRIQLRDDDDPALRLGLRLAVADRTAHLLGGELILEPGDNGAIGAVALRIRGEQPQPERRTGRRS